MRHGRVGALGFSFHDKYDLFQEIVDAYDHWALCQVQYNYMGVDQQAGRRGVAYAAGKGLAVVIMEPLLGGRLVSPPPCIQAIWDRARHRRTPADWGLQWLWSQPEISVVLSGMSTLAQVQENIASASASQVHLLTDEELALFDQVRQAYRALSPIPCTRCEYCLPCPEGVNIPRLLAVVNTAVMFDAINAARRDYSFVPAEERADRCRACRRCEELCPQGIAISDWMLRIHGALAEGRNL